MKLHLYDFFSVLTRTIMNEITSTRTQLYNDPIQFDLSNKRINLNYRYDTQILKIKK